MSAPSNASDGGPAFPAHLISGSSYSDLRSPAGMSLRDYFAAQALASCPMEIKQYDDIADGIQGGARRAKVAYVIADAMLKERAK